jgi:hypothetical protein
MRNGEAGIQASVVCWLRQAAPDAITFSVLNDGLYSKSDAAKRRWMGLLAGVPDLCVIDRGGRAFFLEIKQPGGKPSEIQQEVMTRLDRLGSLTAVVCSLEEAQRTLAGWGVVEL